MSKEGWIITSSNPFVNIPNYPDTEALLAALKAHGHVKLIDLDALTKEHNLGRAANMVLLGDTAEFLGLSFETLADSVRTVFESKGEAVVDLNIKALEIGRAFK